jgi:hypothetical protein
VSDPELKAALAALLVRYNRIRAALRVIYKIVNARGPINMAARMVEIDSIAGRALGRRK